MRGPLLSAIVAAACLCSLDAFADKVPPPPKDCIEGSIAATGHGGPYCRPLSCKADGDCKGGTVCKELPLCVGEVRRGGRKAHLASTKSASVLDRCAKADGSKCSLPPDAADRYWGVKDGKCQSLQICVSGAAAPIASTTPTAEPKASAEPQTPTTDPTASVPQGTPPEVNKRPPCSCASSSGGMPFSMFGFVLLWLATHRRK